MDRDAAAAHALKDGPSDAQGKAPGLAKAGTWTGVRRDSSRRIDGPRLAARADASQVLRAAREAAGYSQDQIADAIGMSRAAWRGYEDHADPAAITLGDLLVMRARAPSVFVAICDRITQREESPAEAIDSAVRRLGVAVDAAWRAGSVHHRQIRFAVLAVLGRLAAMVKELEG